MPRCRANDPWNLGRPLRTNYPLVVAYTMTGPNSYQPAEKIDQGIPPLTAPETPALPVAGKPASPITSDSGETP